MTDYPKKLIEVSIPLKEINEASAREKSIRHGHPSTLHLWWARRPLAAARAVLFCQLVDDPSGYVEELKADKEKRKRAQHEVELDLKMTPHISPKLEDKLVEKERERLHDLVKELVIWENTTNETLLNRARKEIQYSWKRTCRREGKPEDTPMPPLLDPFAGGGAIPLEAQRLGLEAHASDLNPVAVLINKAMIEIPPKFAGLPPVNPDYQKQSKSEKAATTWTGAQGLAEDVRYYGNWMRDEAKKRIGNLYPPYILTKELIESRPDLKKAGYEEGHELTVIAWLWARTVPSPNPALGGKLVPMVSSFWLSKKKGKEAYIEPVVEDGEYRFEVRVGVPEDASKVDSGTKAGRGANFGCLLSDVPIGAKYIRGEACDGRMDAVLMAVVAEGKRGRVYLNADVNHVNISQAAQPTWKPDQKVPTPCHDVDRLPMYGMPTWGDAFTKRQLVALTTFTELVGEARTKALSDAQAITQFVSDSQPLELGGRGIQAYTDSLAVYLAFQVDQLANHQTTICGWHTNNTQLRNTFARQAIPMTWDYAESNPFCDSSGCLSNLQERLNKGFGALSAFRDAKAVQKNASTEIIQDAPILSTDPPYYDNIGYADLSDFFYVWLRKSLQGIMPQAMGSILVPKAEELIASPYRQGSKAKAEAFFLKGMSNVARNWASSCSTVYPTTIYYAFKQAEIKKDGIASTGWATFLGAVMEAGFSIVGTWPVRTEMVNKIGQKANMLASSIVLVCRQRPKDAGTAFKRDFIEALEDELPKALRELQYASLSPVDLPQAAIGPGMAIFSRYERVVTGDMASVSVTEALQLINHELSSILDGQVSSMDPWTRFACKWFAQYCFTAGHYGDAETMANAVNVAVDKVEEAGIIESGNGKVRILIPSELPDNWDPLKDSNRTIWEVVHHLVRIADTGSDADCAAILAQLPNSEVAEAKQLCYRLSTLSDQNGWSKESQSYNQLINNWTEYTDLASNLSKATAQPTQTDLELH